MWVVSVSNRASVIRVVGCNSGVFRYKVLVGNSQGERLVSYSQPILSCGQLRSNGLLYSTTTRLIVSLQNGPHIRRGTYFFFFRPAFKCLRCFQVSPRRTARMVLGETFRSLAQCPAGLRQ